MATAKSYVSAPARSKSTNASSAAPGHRTETADSRPDMNRVGSASDGSHDSHATASLRSAAHDARVAVLPYPAGADKAQR